MSIFPNLPSENDEPKSFQELWNTLDRNKEKFEYLFGHQLKILESIYDAFGNASQKDFALCLPTGTGKTTIGLLLAYFTMLSKGVKAIYLCPNKFLCEQVLNEAKQLGIPASRVYGSWPRISEDQKGPFLNGMSVGVATYSTLFNSNPRVGNLGLIIIDDAHASGDSIISSWDIRITKKDNLHLFQKVFDVLSPVLNKDQLVSLNTSSGKVELCEMLYSKQWLYIVDDLIRIFDSHKDDKELKYTWDGCKRKIENMICLLSHNSIEIRPITPPSLEIKEFQNAHYRIYMSATIDKTGNLENIAGIEKVHWISQEDVDVPGNRLILNLNTLMRNITDENRITRIASKVNRLIVLTQSEYHQTKLKASLELVGYKGRILTPLSENVSSELKSFKKEGKAILILAGRYDGIDLGDGSAEAIVIYHLPEAINNLEIFTSTKWETKDEAEARAIQRIHQGMGRCTRKESDEVMIFLVGLDLVNLLFDPEVLKTFPGRLRLELEMCKLVSNPDNLDDIIEEFINNGVEWKIRKADINKRAPNYKRYSGNNSIFKESNFMFAKFDNLVWIRNHSAAIDLAVGIARRLSSKGNSPDSAVWYYLAGVASDLSSFLEGKDPYKSPGHGYFNQAVSYSHQRSWFGGLSNYVNYPEINTDLKERIDGISGFLGRYPPENDSLEELFKEALDGLRSKGDNQLKAFLRVFGESLGYEALSPTRDAAPDCIWHIDHKVYFIFEAKLEKTNDKLSVNEVRQITSQPGEVKTNENMAVSEDFLVTCVTDINRIAIESSNFLDKFYVLRSEEILKFASDWFNKLLSFHKRAFKDRSFLDTLIHASLVGQGYDTKGITERFNSHLGSVLLVTD